MDKVIGEYTVKVRFPREGNKQENVNPLDIAKNYTMKAEIEHIEDVDRDNKDGTYKRTQIFEIKSFEIE